MTRFTRLIVNCAITALCLSPLTAEARDYYVSSRTGGNHNGTSPNRPCRSLTLQVHRFARLQPGDTVYVGPGNYTPLVDLAKRGVNGTKENPIRFIADPECKHFPNGRKGPVTIYSEYDSESPVVVSLDSNYVVFEGFSVAAEREEAAVGIRVRSSTGNVIRNCDFKHLESESEEGDAAIVVRNADCLIQNCTINFLAYAGIDCQDGSTTVIENCQFFGNRRRAISCEGKDSKLTVRRCRIRRSRTGIWLDPNLGGLVENCWIQDCSRNAIASRGYGRSIIRHCTIANNNGHGIWLQTGPDKYRNGIQVVNTIFANNGGVALNHVSKTRHGNNTATMKHSHNLFYKNRLGDMTEALSRDESEVFADPRFANGPSGAQPKLSSDSPAIDAGLASADVRDDFVGGQRPVGKEPDIGAVERPGASDERPSVYYLTTKGSDRAKGDSPDRAWRSYQHALTHIEPGDTLYIGGGKYTHEHFAVAFPGTLRSSIRIVGDTDGSKTGFPGQVTIQPPNRRRAIRIDGEYFSFENITFDGRNYSQGILSVARGDVKFTRCHWIGGLTAGSFTGPHHFEKCHFRTRSGVGVGTLYEDDRDQYRPPHRSSFIECTVDGRYAQVSFTDTNALYSNTPIVHSVRVDRCNFNSTDFRVSGTHLVLTNSVFTNSRYATWVRGVRHAQGDRVSAVIANNTYYNTAYYTFLFADRCDVRLVNNIVVKSNRYAIFGYNDQAKVTQSNNIFHEYRVLIRGFRNFTMNTDFIKQDPRFVNPRGRNFDLREGSPAIDTGQELDYSDNDLLGRGRPIGRGFDIGAIESEHGADDDPGLDAPVPTLWGVSGRQAALFSIKNYNQTSATMKRYGVLKRSNRQLTNVASLALDRGARAYLTYDGEFKGKKVSFLGRVNTNVVAKSKGTNTSTIEVQEIGPIVGAGKITGLAFQPGTRQLFAVSEDLNLYVLNKLNGGVQLSKRIHFPDGSDSPLRIALAPAPEDLTFDDRGRLFVVDRAHVLYQVDHRTGAITRKVKNANRNLSLKGVAFDHMTGRLIGSSTSNWALFQLRVPKGVMRRLGPIGLPDVTGLAINRGEGVKGSKIRIVEWKVLRSKDNPKR